MALDIPEYNIAISRLDNLIERFKQLLPAFTGHARHSAKDTHDLLVTHALCQCATIQLHRGLVGQNPNSMTRCLTAANMVAYIVQTTDVRDMGFISPIMAVSAHRCGPTMQIKLMSKFLGTLDDCRRSYSAGA